MHFKNLRFVTAATVKLYERLRVATIYIQIALNDTFTVCLRAFKTIPAADDPQIFNVQLMQIYGHLIRGKE